jgi:hypothetical protein
MMIRRAIPALLALSGLLASAAVTANAQSAAGSGSSSQTTQSSSSSTTQSTTTQTQTPQGSQPSMMSPHVAHVQPGQTYVRPTSHQRLVSYAFDTFGPYPLIGSAIAAGIQQAESPATPPEWGGGAGPYGERVASNFGINLITQTTKYGLSEVFREDNLYYRCECSGFGRRAGHALISTVTARRGDDGHRVFSIPAVVAPYAGTEAAALLWYPSRYNAMDGFRMGNYNLLTQAGLNLALEFLWGGPNTLLHKHHVPVVSDVTGSTHPN